MSIRQLTNGNRPRISTNRQPRRSIVRGPMGGRFDVAVVGASIGGCPAARLFGLAGARVALIERRPDPDAYKVVCTHQILSSAVPTIERLGLAGRIEAAGALRSHPAAWSPHGGWMRFPGGGPYGSGAARPTLVPIPRSLAAPPA